LASSRLDERRTHDALTRGAFEHEEVAVTAGLRDQFAGLAVDGGVEQNRGFDGVPIMRVVRRGWKYQTSFPVSGFSATMAQV